ncbi:MAG: protease SohB, partial [Enterobacterales bacterium]|nr:protease SohB [Enterobacterales bacterium]
MEWLSLYGLFLAKVMTFVIAIGALIVLFVSLRHKKGASRGELQLTDLGEQYRDMQRNMQEARMDDSALKAWYKQQKKQDKEKAKQRKAEVKQGIAAK